jgi:hypothetical protein
MIAEVTYSVIYAYGSGMSAQYSYSREVPAGVHSYRSSNSYSEVPQKHYTGTYGRVGQFTFPVDLSTRPAYQIIPPTHF